MIVIVFEARTLRVFIRTCVSSSHQQFGFTVFIELTDTEGKGFP